MKSARFCQFGRKIPFTMLRFVVRYEMKGPVDRTSETMNNRKLKIHSMRTLQTRMTSPEPRYRLGFQLFTCCRMNKWDMNKWISKKQIYEFQQQTTLIIFGILQMKTLSILKNNNDPHQNRYMLNLLPQMIQT